LLQTPAFQFTEEEQRELREAIKMERLGRKEYLAHQALWQLLRPIKNNSASPLHITCYQEANQAHFDTLEQLFSFYHGCRKVELTVAGCCYPAFTEALAAMLAAPSLSSPAAITHYLRCCNDSCVYLARALSSIRPLLSRSNYAAYIADPNYLTPEAMTLYKKNEFLCAFVDEKGKQRWHHGVLDTPDHLMLVEYPARAMYAFHADQLMQFHEKLLPVKPRFSTQQLQGYVEYIQFFRKLEWDKEIYSLKPDLPFHVIHPDLLLSAVYDCIPTTPFAAAANLELMLQEMYMIQLQRWKNIFEKKKVTHMIFSFQTMLDFARTGVQTDHFFAMRPFTPEERRKILSHLRNQMQENPYFNIYFASEETTSFQLEICGYENTGVLFSSTTTSYNLSQEYMDAVIWQQAFCQTYRNFFLSEFLPARVHPPRESLIMMDQIIDAIPAENDQ